MWRRIVTGMACVVVFCTVYVLILPAITMEQSVFCGQEEHIHTAGCFRQDSEHNLICSAELLGMHIHTDACYSVSEENAINHIHTDMCVSPVKGELICTESEREGHTHTEDCYSWYEENICGLEEGQPEEGRVLICEEPAVAIHIHDTSCFEEQTSECTEDHDHTEACEGWTLSCELQVHKHDLMCYSNPEADVESASIWERTMDRVELTGNYRTDLLSIARTQLGYTESSDNYIVNEDQTIRGYTRYGDWYGDKYGDWCAMFLSFCLNYAEVEGMPLDSDCQNWIQNLSDETQDLYRTKDVYDPRPGDLIFFDWNGDGLANHVGLVERLEENENGIVLTTLEGNSSNRVKTNTYGIDDNSILGYAMLPFREVVCIAEIYTDDTYEFLSDDTTVITLTGSVPNDAKVRAFPVTVETEMEVLCAYDIAIFRADGSVYEPDTSVRVHIANSALEITEDSEIEMEVYYIPDEGNPEPMDTSVSKDGVTFDAPHFSTYAVMAVQPRATYANVSNASTLASNLSSGNSVRLTADFTVDPTITVGGNGPVYLDLNGHTITCSGSKSNSTGDPMIMVPNGKSLIIQDSQATEETVTATTLNPLGAHGASVDTSNGVKLTYYVTRSEITNAATGATTEMVDMHEVTGQGKIKGAGVPIFMVEGMLTLESGMLYGGTQRAILANSGDPKVNITGGYICGFNRSSSSAAIYMNPGVLNISGNAVIAGNQAGTFGGAINIKTAELNMTGGIIAGNVSSNPDKNTGDSGSDYDSGKLVGGGAIRIEKSEFNFSGGYITNNNCKATGYWGGGGGIWMEDGSTLNMSGGYITGNQACAGGGVKSEDIDSADTINITGGFICSNLTTYAEGGGVSIGIYDTGVITGGYINHNHAECHVDWGGGGVFVANGGYLYVRNALITNNHAGGFGGGIAGCSTARMHISVNEGAAIYDNSADGQNMSGKNSTKNEDWILGYNNPVFMQNGYADIFSALNCTVEGSMLGDGIAYWQGTCDGIVVRSNSALDVIRSETMLGLTSHPSTQSMANAQADAKVFFNGNSSYTHGGAILCNGYMEVGTPHEVIIGARIEVTAKKSVQNLTMIDDQFTFVIEDSSGNIIATGTNDANGAITFDGRIPLRDQANHVYYIYEVAGENASIIYDTTKYKMTVVTECVQYDGVDDEKVLQCKVQNLKVEKWNGQYWETVIGDYNPTDSANAAIQVDLGSATFTNKLRDSTNIKVEKFWDCDTNNIPECITVNLLRNGTVHQTVTLNTSNNWTYTWSDLKVRESNWYNSITYEYKVEEVVPDGFNASYTYNSTSGGTEVLITNRIKTYGLDLTKVNEAGDLLEGAVFNILDSNGNTLTFLRNQSGAYELSKAKGALPDMTTDAKGKLAVTGLPAETYILKEIKAPLGYTLTDPVTLTLGSNSEDPNANRVLAVTVVNTKAPYILPETGGSGNSLYAMGGMLLMAAGLTLLYNRTKRRKEEDASF